MSEASVATRISNGSRNPRWSKWGLREHTTGHLIVRVGRDHPFADKDGWAYLHTIVWAAAGRSIPPGYSIHHLDGDKLNNRLENLESVDSIAHAKAHLAERRAEDQLRTQKEWDRQAATGE